MVRAAPVYFHVSVVVPTCNDAGLIQATLQALKASPEVQVIVVDSGSTDDTLALAAKHDVRLVSAAPQRGRQMRMGISSSNGDVIVFCPPGNLLSPQIISRMLWTLSDPEVVGGDFQFTFLGGRFWAPARNVLYRILRALGMRPQYLAWFVWRTACEGYDGFRGLPIYEDLDLLNRLRRQGKLTRVQEPVPLVPSREGHRLIWTLLQVLYHMGVSAGLLGRWYHKPSARGGRVDLQQSAARPAINP